MENRVKDIFDLLITDDRFDNDAKMGITHVILNAITAEDLPISDDLRLRVNDTENHELMNMELFYYKKDEDGNISYRNMNADKEQLINVMYKEYLKEKEDVKRL